MVSTLFTELHLNVEVSCHRQIAPKYSLHIVLELGPTAAPKLLQMLRYLFQKNEIRSALVYILRFIDFERSQKPVKNAEPRQILSGVGFRTHLAIAHGFEHI